MTSEKPVLTQAEVAVALGVAPVTVRRWCEEGRLTPIRESPRIFDTADVQALAAELASELGDMVREAARAAS